ncbi:MAG TPA: chemotaxis protein CheB, partial [Thermoanaerobaculia bacterium]|nr:chemotaxis protein CheB [Thermoanaerobaculia bacterium]
MGGSAGGIEAFIDLLKTLPEHPGMAFIFVLHQDPRHESNLAQVLKRVTRMPVDVIQNGTKVQRDRVYIAP